MNRNFEEEYKKYADIDTPDLWSRIEAGVDALEENLKESKDDSQALTDSKIIDITSSPRYTADNSRNTNDSIGHADNAHDNKAGKINDQRKAGGIGKSRFAVFARKYGGMVAAVACGVAVLSVIGITKLASKADYSAAPMAESAAPAAMAEAPSDAAMNESASNATDEATMEMEEAADDAYAMAEEAPAMAEDTAEEAEAYAMEAEKAEESYDLSDEAMAAEAYAEENTHTNGSYNLNSETSDFKSGNEEKRKISDSLDLNTADIAATSGTELTVLKISSRIVSITEDTASDDSGDKMLICKLNVTDPMDTGLKKGEEITAYVDPSINELIASIQGKSSGTAKQYKVTLIHTDDKYLLTDINTPRN